MAQLSKSRHQRSICAGVTRAGSSTNDASMRASYQPVSQSAAASSWLRPRRLASTCMFAIDTPNALFAVMPNRARFSRSRRVLICSSDESAAWTCCFTPASTPVLGSRFAPSAGGSTFFRGFFFVDPNFFSSSPRSWLRRT